jgi:hypothetical protein
MTANIVRNMPMDAYHATQALSASGAWTLIQECPAQFWYDSPWNPDLVPDNSPEFDIGTATHLAVLEQDRLAERVACIDAKDYKTRAAQEARKWAYDSGLVPLLPHQLDLVRHLSAAVRADPWAADLLDGAEPELSIFWNADRGVRCKARPDLVTRDGSVIGDIKTCPTANPRVFQRVAFNSGHFLRAPWYIDGYEMATGQHIHDYWFIIVAKEPPHLVSTLRLGERAIEWGRMMIRKSLALFDECQRVGEWPNYCREPATLELPTWAEFQLQDRNESGEFSAEDARRSMEFLSP